MQLARILAFPFSRKPSLNQTVKSVLDNAPEPLRTSEHGLLSWRDVDVVHASDSELIYMVAEVLRECKGSTLSDESVAQFWKIRAEIERRRELKLSVVDDEEGQDVVEYAVMLALIIVLVVGTVRLIGSSANATFSSVASALQ